LQCASMPTYDSMRAFLLVELVGQTGLYL